MSLVICLPRETSPQDATHEELWWSLPAAWSQMVGVCSGTHPPFLSQLPTSLPWATQAWDLAPECFPFPP